MEFNSHQCPDFVLPQAEQLSSARSAIIKDLPIEGKGPTVSYSHIRDELCPGLSNSSKSTRYYGFVTGGSTPAARLADEIVSEYDQNLSVHLPSDSIATDIEYHALRMLCQLVDLNPNKWPHRIFTTGATASNIMGLACGREYVVAKIAATQGKEYSVSIDGLQDAMNFTRVQILCTTPHSSIYKASSMIGLGHSAILDCSLPEARHKFDLNKLRKALQTRKTSSIILIACCEVNAGLFATENLEEMQAIRRLADDHDAWIHVDGAMGLMARVLPHDANHTVLKDRVQGMELADSITGDGHKLLNVPYDTGFFFSKHLALATNVFQNPNAAYLRAGPSEVPSPLNIGIENSRRFRALPVYASLVSYGYDGYSEMLQRQIAFTRMIAEYLLSNTAYQLCGVDLTRPSHAILSEVFMIVMFRALDEAVNNELTQRINRTRLIYCSGTLYNSKPASRIAVSHWACDPTRDFQKVRQVLEDVLKDSELTRER